MSIRRSTGRRAITASPSFRACRSARQFSNEFCSNSDCRHIQVTFENGVELHDFYVPAGADIPDPARQSEIRAQARLPARDGAVLREARRPQRSRGDGRRPQRRAARERRLEPQAACSTSSATRRSRPDCSASVKASFDWTDVTREFVPREREELFVVELSRERLGGLGPRPQARPHLGEPGAQRRAQIAARSCARCAAGSSPPTTCRWWWSWGCRSKTHCHSRRGSLAARATRGKGTQGIEPSPLGPLPSHRLSAMLAGDDTKRGR